MKDWCRRWLRELGKAVALFALLVTILLFLSGEQINFLYMNF
jgi:hypothetical protein